MGVITSCLRKPKFSDGSSSTAALGAGSPLLLQASDDHSDSISSARSPAWILGPKLGSGGQAQVYLAVDANTGEPRAVKETVLPSASHPKLHAVVQEVQALRLLQHPHVVKYYGAHATNLKNNRLKLQVFTELVDGVALEEILASKEPFIPRVVAHYARQVALGLSYMHCHGVAHGDLKSDNVIIGWGGVAKIVDLGSASIIQADRKPGRHIQASHSVSSLASSPDSSRVVGGSTSGTTHSHVHGSPQFMAPELARGEAASSASDVWALGAIMYHMLTGSHLLDPVGAASKDAPALPVTPSGIMTELVSPAAADPQCRAGKSRGLATQNTLESMPEGSPLMLTTTNGQAQSHTPVRSRHFQERGVSSATSGPDNSVSSTAASSQHPGPHGDVSGGNLQTLRRLVSLQASPKLPTSLPAGLRSVVDACLALDPADRPSCAQLLLSPWLLSAAPTPYEESFPPGTVLAAAQTLSDALGINNSEAASEESADASRTATAWRRTHSSHGPSINATPTSTPRSAQQQRSEVMLLTARLNTQVHLLAQHLMLSSEELGMPKRAAGRPGQQQQQQQQQPSQSPSRARELPPPIQRIIVSLQRGMMRDAAALRAISSTGPVVRSQTTSLHAHSIGPGSAQPLGSALSSVSPVGMPMRGTSRAATRAGSGGFGAMPLEPAERRAHAVVPSYQVMSTRDDNRFEEAHGVVLVAASSRSRPTMPAAGPLARSVPPAIAAPQSSTGLPGSASD